MITLIHHNAAMIPVIHTCETIEETLAYSFLIWHNFGRFCTYHYNGHKLNIDIMNKTEEEIIISFQEQIDVINGIDSFVEWD